ncbi:uncharacterized protein LDX57_008574 [Aspergillus melleus]|uniref:uncharacterized protein n=1 Tax=Aspergillus melleus TaxID=138277 RepID=UPI001E8D5A22|nr:uncharacterized protein LDX57_008574 [Aspergillus melleus]KAH8430910.1 hypothetical protein LDX57_008574 [Aspergillus melleus]
MPPRTSTTKGPSGADGKPTWKSKFTDKQLERKRQVDRISQRRTRQNSKQVAAQLQEKMNLLSSGDHKGLLEQMLAENEGLTSKLNLFQNRLDQIHRLSNECLEVEDVPNPARGHRSVGRSLTSSGFDSTPMGDGIPADVGKMFSKQPSIFLHIIEQMRETHGGDMPRLTPNRFVESTMAWKYSQGSTDGLDYLVQHFQLRGFTIKDTLFRKTAYLAYQLMRPWRGCYHSHLELEALFWAQYRHLLFFVLPSTENLAKCLPWYRPTPSMFLYDHPGYIDFLLWPHLHEQLKGSWKKYNTESLIGNLIRRFNVSNADIDPKQPQIYVKNRELHLSKIFERALADASNFRMQPHLFTRSPEVVNSGSLVAPNPPATGDSTRSTHTVCGASNTNVQTHPYGLDEPIWTHPFPSDSYLLGSITSAVPEVPPKLDYRMTRSNETLDTECIDGNFLIWNNCQMGSGNLWTL